jgi:hypothetical protein
MVPQPTGDAPDMPRPAPGPTPTSPSTSPADSSVTASAGAGSGSLRASDADREQVNEVLNTAYAEGRLTRDEYDQRTDEVLAAKTFDDLIPITRDLVYAGSVPPSTAPQPAGIQVDPAHAERESERMVAIFGGVDRTGRWRVRRHTRAFAMFGGVDLDLREAVFDAPEIEISGLFCFGGMDIKVPEGVEIRDQTVAIFGGTDTKKVDPPEPGAPVLVLKGTVVFGGIDVKTVRPKKSHRRQQSGDSVPTFDGLDRWRQRIEDRTDERLQRWEQRRRDRLDRRRDRWA